jgi:hypothetical protein
LGVLGRIKLIVAIGLYFAGGARETRKARFRRTDDPDLLATPAPDSAQEGITRTLQSNDQVTTIDTWVALQMNLDPSSNRYRSKALFH